MTGINPGRQGTRSQPRAVPGRAAPHGRGGPCRNSRMGCGSCRNRSGSRRASRPGIGPER